MTGLTFTGAVLAHQGWIVVTVVMTQTVIGCVTVLFLAYSVDRKHRARLVKNLSTALIAVVTGTAAVSSRGTPSVPQEQSQADREPDPVRPARHRGAASSTGKRKRTGH